LNCVWQLLVRLQHVKVMVESQSSQFHQHFTSSFCADVLTPNKLLCQTVIRQKLCKAIYMKKLLVNCWWNDTCCQFHRHFMSSFCSDILVPQNYKAIMWLEKSCAKHFCTKKPVIKLLVKLTPDPQQKLMQPSMKSDRDVWFFFRLWFFAKCKFLVAKKWVIH